MIPGVRPQHRYDVYQQNYVEEIEEEQVTLIAKINYNIPRDVPRENIRICDEKITCICICTIL